MRKALFLITVFFLSAFIFFKSNTWESYKVVETKRGMRYVSIKHRLRWDRFFNYVQHLPKKILESDAIRSVNKKAPAASGDTAQHR